MPPSNRSISACHQTVKASLLKVILLGDGHVGKTSLIKRFVSNMFSESTETCLETIGVESLNKNLIVNGQQFSLHFWDTAGQEQFKSLRTPFYRDSNICLLVFSLTDRESFDNLQYWREEFLYHAHIQGDDFPFVLLGNKSDDVASRVLSPEEVNEFVGSMSNMIYFETSAKADHNVEKAFLAAIKKFQEFELTLMNRDSFGDRGNAVEALGSVQ